MNPVEVFNGVFNFLLSLIKPLVNWMLEFLPNGEPVIFRVIDSIGQLGSDLTFNVFYFVDIASVLLCFGVLVNVVLIVNLVKLIFRSINLASMSVEAIPWFE